MKRLEPRIRTDQTRMTGRSASPGPCSIRVSSVAQPMGFEPLPLSSERRRTSGIRSKQGATDRSKVGGPVADIGRLDVRAACDRQPAELGQRQGFVIQTARRQSDQ